MSMEEDLTVLVDYEKYQTNLGSSRVRRQASNAPPASAIGAMPGNDYQQDHHHHETEIEVIVEPCHNKDKCDKPKVCADPVNEVYQQCGNKCVLGCRYASLTSGITLAKHDCEKNDCVEGCFCKTGLVRHQAKCIPAAECPIRKCQKNEVYVSVCISRPALLAYSYRNI